MTANQSVMNVIAPLHSRCSACLEVLAREKSVNLSIVRSCGEFEQ